MNYPEKNTILLQKTEVFKNVKMSTKDLLNTLSRYDSRRKVKNNRKKLLKIKLEKVDKIQNISKNELGKAERLQNKSLDELRGIARLRRIKRL